MNLPGGDRIAGINKIRSGEMITEMGRQFPEQAVEGRAAPRHGGINRPQAIQLLLDFSDFGEHVE